MAYLRTEEAEALRLAQAADEALRAADAAGERFREALRLANEAEVARRGGRTSGVALPCTRLVDSRHAGLRHALAGVQSYVAGGGR